MLQRLLSFLQIRANAEGKLCPIDRGDFVAHRMHDKRTRFHDPFGIQELFIEFRERVAFDDELVPLSWYASRPTSTRVSANR